MRTAIAALFALLLVATPVAAGTSQQASSTVRPRGLIVLTYPAGIVPRAMPAIRAGFNVSKWPSGCAKGYFGLIDVGGCPTRDTALEETLIKTAYYALDAYTALAEEFGREAVVLEPATVSVGPDSQLTYVLPDPELPAAVRIDFAAVVSPRVESDTPSWTSTHGHYFMPAYVIRDGSGRLLAASKHLDGLQDASSQPSVLIRIRSLGLKLKAADQTKPVIIGVAQRSFDEKTWRAHTSSLDGNPPLAVDLIKQDLSSIAPLIASAQPGDASAYAALFRDEIAANPVVTQTLLPEFIRAEAQFVSGETVSGLQSLRAGDFGASVRERLLAERKENRDAANAAFFGGLLMMSTAMSNYSHGISVGPDALMAQSATNQKLSEMNQAFTQSFAGVGMRQTSLALNVGGTVTTVQVGTLAQLRAEFRQLIRRSTPKRTMR